MICIPNMKFIKPSLILILCLIGCLPIKAQQLDRQVIATAGNSNATSSFTIGEVLVSSSNLEVTAGFQQPHFIAEPVTSIKDITRDLQVFPVPTKDIVTIKGYDFQEQTTTVTLYTLEGKQAKIEIERLQNEMKLDLRNLPSGSYYLTLTDNTKLTIAKYKIIKIK